MNSKLVRRTALPVALVLAAAAAVVTLLPKTADAGTTRAADPRVTVKCANRPSDAAMINRAISASRNGNEIFFGGPCLINRPIKLLGGRTYLGGSRTGTVLKQAAGANLPAMMISDSYLDNTVGTGYPLAVRHLTLDGNRSKNTATTIGLLIRSWQTSLDDLHVVDMGGDGIRLTNVSKNGTELTSTQVNGEIVDSFIENSGGSGVYVEDTGNAVTDWHLRNNFIATTGGDAVHLDNAAGWIIERNHIYDVGENAINANRLFATTISDNLIEDFGKTAQAGTWAGISATIQGDSASTIVGNRIFNYAGDPNVDSKYLYLSVARVNYNVGVLGVTGNVIRGSGTPRSTGLSYETGGGGTLQLTSSANLVYEVGTPEVVGAGVVMVAGR